MKSKKKKREKNLCVFGIIFDTVQKIMEFTHDFIQRNKLSKNVQFGSVTEILMAEKIFIIV